MKKRTKKLFSVGRYRALMPPASAWADMEFFDFFKKGHIILACRGNAAIELALLSPLLVILLTGTIALGLGLYQAMQVQAAAEAGALYAANNGTANLTAIEAAVTGATGTPGITASPIPVIYYGCPTATGIVSQTNSTAVCASGVAPGLYITVSAMITRTNLISSSFLNLSLPTTFTGTAVIRTH